jgi:hypothetical protein
MRRATRSSAASPVPQGSAPTPGHGDRVVSDQPSDVEGASIGEEEGGVGSSSA